MKLLRNVLLPIVPIYQAITWLRNKAYDTNLLTSKRYDFPIITVGNLSVGGTGKTPMIEYLIRLLSPNYSVASLSRGYKRKTKGFVVADSNASAQSIGDEPYQFYNKFQDIIVSVDVNRQNGIAQLRNLSPKPNVILLDDAYQHRKVQAGLSILLTTYTNLYADDFVLPTGNLREPKCGAKRADIIVVTKCPKRITANQQNQIKYKLSPEKQQQVFFSTIQYSKFIYGLGNTKQQLNTLKSMSFTLVTGIANPKTLVRFLNAEGFVFQHLKFKDHHEFSSKDITLLEQKKIVLTTEKDFMRLKDRLNVALIYYLPIEAVILEKDKFNALIEQYVARLN